MAAAVLLTLLALAGVSAGVVLGHARKLSSYVGAAGGGLLFGIALFWLLPEIVRLSNWLSALLLVSATALLLAASDHLLPHSGPLGKHRNIGPLFAATAIHSFLDGWSVRALGSDPMASVTVAIGLALHKIPEGIALGWIARRSMDSARKALLLSAGVELLTLAGALVEPRADQSGFSLFGIGWTTCVLAVIAGSFSFLGLHAVVPMRRQVSVMAVFLGTLLVMASVAAIRFH